MGNLNINTESELWRWYTQDYLPGIIEPPTGLSIIVDKLKKSDLLKLIKKLINIIMNKMQIGINNNGKPPIAAPGKPPIAASPEQQGGSYSDYDLFNQTEDVGPYYVYRMEAYNELMVFLSKKNIKISLLTKQFLKKLYLYHYTIEYVKVLNYILFNIKQHTFSPKLRYIVSTVFNRLGNQIYDGICM